LSFERARTLCFRWRGTNLGILKSRTRLELRHFEFVVSFWRRGNYLSQDIETFPGRKNATLPLSAPPFPPRGANTRLSSEVLNSSDNLCESIIMPITILSADLQSMGLDGGDVEHSSFPAATKQAAGLVNGAQTNVSSVYFTDKILITVSQGGRLSQWVHLTILF
jgi:hypothetical protein